MSGVNEKVAEVEFSFETALDAAGVAAACDRAAQTRIRGGGGKFRELQRGRTQSGGYAIHYAVLMGIGIESARFSVTWSETDGGCRGRLSVSSFNTSQQKALVVIPVSPKSVPSLRVLRRFVEAFRIELGAHAPAPKPVAPKPATAAGVGQPSGYSAPTPPVQPVPQPLVATPPVTATPRPTPAPAAAQPASGQQPAGWFPDPHGRHEHRYWDGSAWTARVSSRGVISADPV